MSKIIQTPIGTVVGYNLDKPFKQPATEWEGTRVTNGYLSLKVKFDSTLDDFKLFKSTVEKQGYKLVDIIEVKEDGSKVIEVGLTSSTNWKPFIKNKFGEEIEAPTNVRTNYGDVMKVIITGQVEKYTNKGKEGTKFKMYGVTILDHDTSKRKEPEKVAQTKAEVEAAMAANFVAKPATAKEEAGEKDVFETDTSEHALKA